MLATSVALACIAVAAVLTLVRLILGPTLADRVVATDLLLTFLVMSAAVLSVRAGRGEYLTVMLVVAIVGFLGTSAVARYIERRGA